MTVTLTLFAFESRFSSLFITLTLIITLTLTLTMFSSELESASFYYANVDCDGNFVADYILVCV